MQFINRISNKQIIKHAMIKFYSGIYEGAEVVAVISGVCKVNAAIAAQLLIDKFRVTHIILTGVAGGLSGQLKIGDIVIAKEIAYHDVASKNLTKYHPYMEDMYFKPDNALLRLSEEAAQSIKINNKYYTGRIITGEAFITHNERASLIERFNPLCVDMESASIAHTCYVNSIPFIIIRAISDNADEKGAETFENNVETAASNAIELAEEIIKKIQII